MWNLSILWIKMLLAKARKITQWNYAKGFNNEALYKPSQSQTAPTTKLAKQTKRQQSFISNAFGNAKQ